MNFFLQSLSLLLACATMAQVQPAFAQQNPARQDPEQLRRVAEDYLRRQAAGLPGEATITVNAFDPRMNLPACGAPEAFLPPGSRLWGRTNVGIRCSVSNGGSNWTVYIAASIRLQGEYLAAAQPIMAGQPITAANLIKVRGELTALPQSVLTDPSHAVGKITTLSLPPGAPLRAELLRAQRAIQQGQTIKLVSGGPGFKVSSEGRAMSNGVEGQLVQVSTAGGQMISGIARTGGVVEVAF